MNGLYKKLKLFRGSIGEVARRSNMTYQSVESILKDGKWTNDEVVKHAEQVIKERKAEFDAAFADG